MILISWFFTVSNYLSDQTLEYFDGSKSDKQRTGASIWLTPGVYPYIKCISTKRASTNRYDAGIKIAQTDWASLEDLFKFVSQPAGYAGVPFNTRADINLAPGPCVPVAPVGKHDVCDYGSPAGAAAPAT